MRGSSMRDSTMRASTMRGARLLLVGLLGWSGGAAAMGLSEAFDLATEFDPAIPQSLAIYEADRQLGRQVSGGLKPSVNAFGRAARGRARVESNVFPGGEDEGNVYNAGVELRQPLYRRDWSARGQQAGALDRMADIGREDRIQRLILRVAERYFGVLEARDGLELAQLEQDALDKALEDTRNRAEAGVVAQTELQEARARSDLARAGTIRAEATLDAAQDALDEITNNGYAPLPRLGRDTPLPPIMPSRVEDWLETSRRHSLVLMQARETIVNAQSEAAAQRSAYTPTLDAVAAYDYMDTRDFSDGMERREASIGLELQVPIYQGGANTARSREAAFRLEASRAELARLNLETDRRIRQLFRGVQADLLEVEALRRGEESAASALEATRNGYEAGTRTILDLLDAEARLADARRNFAGARYQFLMSSLTLYYEAGVLSADEIRRLDDLLEPASEAPAFGMSRY